MLPQEDGKYLFERFGDGNFSVTQEADYTCIVVPGYALPAGYDREKSDLLLRLQGGYPDIPPDMWWFNPPVLRVDHSTIPQTESTEHYLGRGWQRWSRHLPQGAWQSGTDGLESFFALLRKELVRAVGGTA
jgi:hypothetical protein